MSYSSDLKKNSLSLCMIVKNEAAYIKECLQSVQDVVDEIIVVDTGSEDETVGMARQFGARVFQFAWRDDFAAARNESIKQATGKWILQLDADERLESPSKDELKKVLKKTQAMCVSVLIDSPKAGGKGHISRAHRLFRNVPGICYSGRIHEQISPSVTKLNGRELISQIRLKHLGYAKSEAEMKSKSERNFRLLQKQIQEEPNNPYWLYTFAQNLILSRRYEEALQALKQALQLGGLPKDIRTSVYNNLAEIHLRTGNYTKAVEFAQKSLSLTENQTMAHLLLFEIHGKLAQPEAQIRCLETVRELLKRKGKACQVSLEAYVDEAAVYINLGKKYLSEKRYREALDVFSEGKERTPKNIAMLKGLGESFVAINDLSKACEVLADVRRLAPDDKLNLEKLGWLYLKLQKFADAIEAYTTLLDLEPANDLIVRRLAGLFIKIGDVDKARTLLTSSANPSRSPLALHGDV